jgi:hypothetical protein
MLFGRKKQSIEGNEMDFLLRDIEKALKIKAYYCKYGHWAKNSRKSGLTELGLIKTRDNQIVLMGKWYRQDTADNLGMNGAHNMKNGKSYIYFRGNKKLMTIHRGWIESIREPSVDLTHLEAFLSYVNNLVVE